MRRTSRALAALLLAAILPTACASTRSAVDPPQPSRPVGVVWSGAGWTVERVGVPGTAETYCIAYRSDHGRDLQFTETQGKVGFIVTDATGQVAPGAHYPIDLRFEPGGTVGTFAVAETTGGRLKGTLPPNPVGANPSGDRVALYGRGAQSVMVSSSVLGPLGRTRLSGSTAALDQLDACDSSTIPPRRRPPPARPRRPPPLSSNFQLSEIGLPDRRILA
jgi:hypothetical protein